MSIPWDDLRLGQVEDGARRCPDACAADVVSLVAEVRRLRTERGDYVLALEQIRSAPLASESSIQRYKRCRDIADQVLQERAARREG